MRTTQKSPCIHSVLHKSNRKKSNRNKTLSEIENEYLAKSRISQQQVKGIYIRLSDVPGNLMVFIPEGKDKEEVIGNYKKKYLSHKSST